MNIETKVKELVKENKNEIVKFAQKIVQTPSFSTKEGNLVNLIKKRCKKLVLMK